MDGSCNSRGALASSWMDRVIVEERWLPRGWIVDGSWMDRGWIVDGYSSVDQQFRRYLIRLSWY